MAAAGPDEHDIVTIDGLASMRGDRWLPPDRLIHASK